MAAILAAKLLKNKKKTLFALNFSNVVIVLYINAILTFMSTIKFQAQSVEHERMCNLAARSDYTRLNIRIYRSLRQ